MKSAIEFELQEAVPILRQTPATLRSLLGELPDRWVESSGDRSHWHPYDILGHLIHGERADWIPRARIILEQGTERSFDPFDREAMFDLPHLSRLAESNIFAETFITMQRQTNRGEYALLCGDYPKLVSEQPKMSELIGRQELRCLPQVLREAGYATPRRAGIGADGSSAHGQSLADKVPSNSCRSH